MTEILHVGSEMDATQGGFMLVRQFPAATEGCEYRMDLGGGATGDYTAQAGPIQKANLRELRSNSRAELLFERKFVDLVRKWKTRTRHQSNLLAICSDPAYQEIISMGQAAVPLILRDLDSELDHWFWALKVLTNSDPVDPADHGDLNAVRQSWLTWGRTHGYI